MISLHIAAPYAKALFDLAMEQPDPEKILADIHLVNNVCAENRTFRLMLKSPIINSGKKLKVIDAIFASKVEKLTLSFLHILIRKNREMFLQDIVAGFINLYKKYKGILTTKLKTATPVTPDIRKAVIALMEKQTGKKIDLVEEIRDELIGGFILEWEDKQYDSSILNDIKKLRLGIARINLYLKGF
ncbi:MAG: ATP synthase F1 subunit delta [Bacteroidota bacterium]|nr:ATP synthase F1 subunit delta [Bacteroidota bacterium]